MILVVFQPVKFVPIRLVPVVLFRQTILFPLLVFAVSLDAIDAGVCPAEPSAELAAFDLGLGAAGAKVVCNDQRRAHEQRVGPHVFLKEMNVVFVTRLLQEFGELLNILVQRLLLPASLYVGGGNLGELGVYIMLALERCFDAREHFLALLCNL